MAPSNILGLSRCAFGTVDVSAPSAEETGRLRSVNAGFCGSGCCEATTGVTRGSGFSEGLAAGGGGGISKAVVEAGGGGGIEAREALIAGGGGGRSIGNGLYG